MAEYLFKGLGFPIVLTDPEMVEVRGEVVPKVNMKALKWQVFMGLILGMGHNPMTGDQFRFIRKCHSVSRRGLAMATGVSVPTLAEWEDTKEAPTGMSFWQEVEFRSWAIHTDIGRHAADPMTPINFRLATSSDPLNRVVPFVTSCDPWRWRVGMVTQCGRTVTSAEDVPKLSHTHDDRTYTEAAHQRVTFGVDYECTWTFSNTSWVGVPPSPVEGNWGFEMPQPDMGHPETQRMVHEAIDQMRTACGL